MVLRVVGALAGVVKVNYSKTVVDSLISQVHYKWTATFLLLAGALVMASDFFGGAIKCLTGSKDAAKIINTYCWITSTYTVNSTGILPGLGRYDEKIHEKTIHAYYQWVPLVLILQAGFFYLPHYIWKCMESKQVDLLLQELNKSLFDESADKKIKNMVSYLKESWGLNSRYFLGHFACESLYLVNVVVQMFIMDKFFNGAFFKYGTEIFDMIQSEDMSKSEIFLEVFPKSAKCTFHKYGPTGDIETQQSLCILPQNILNEKIFLVLWLWFIILTIFTSLQILWHLGVYSSVSLRMKLMSHRIKTTLSARSKQAVMNMQIGDFCLLNSIGYNLEATHFRKVLAGLTEAFEEVHAPSAPLYGTYKPLSNEATAMETLPRRRNLYPDLRQ